jgi:hypothetical protein
MSMKLMQGSVSVNFISPFAVSLNFSTINFF